MGLPMLAAGALGLGGIGAASSAALPALATLGVVGGTTAAAHASGGGWSHLGSGLASLAGTVYGNYASARQAGVDRAWQERMSNTAHQRQVRDLRAAGLNPILSARYGGSSTPGGSTARQAGAEAATMAALTARLNKAQTYLARDHSNLAREQANREIQSAWREVTQAGLNEDLGASAKAQAANYRTQGQILQEQLKVAKNAAKRDTASLPGDIHQGGLWSGRYGDARRWADLFTGGSGARGLKDAINPFSWMLKKLPGK